jgi:2-dehydro-3-deoxygalactonokinase
VTAAFIGLDWGTTSLRAYLADVDGHVLESRQASDGILSSVGRFEETFAAHVADWSASLPVIASGMIGSRQGWVEAPYCPCPAGLDEIAGSLVFHLTQSGRRIAFVPGLSCNDEVGVPDVIRGEETQVLGDVDQGSRLYVLPGTHSKWLRTEDGQITRFATFMSGEIFAALKNHTILGRLMSGDTDDDAAFAVGVRRAHAAPEMLLHTLFGTRTLGLFGSLAPTALASYLSGLVIGTEIAAARRHFGATRMVTILASPVLTKRYADALLLCDLPARAGLEDAAIRGLARIARVAGLVR